MLRVVILKSDDPEEPASFHSLSLYSNYKSKEKKFSDVFEEKVGTNEKE